MRVITVKKYKRVWSIKTIANVVLICVKVQRRIIESYEPGNKGFIKAQENWKNSLKKV
jgi:hypothetical protein